MATRKSTDQNPPAEVAPNHDAVLRRLEALICRCSVAASAAWAIGTDPEGNRSKEAIAALPAVIDEVRRELEDIHSDVELIEWASPRSPSAMQAAGRGAEVVS